MYSTPNGAQEQAEEGEASGGESGDEREEWESDGEGEGDDDDSICLTIVVVVKH